MFILTGLINRLPISPMESNYLVAMDTTHNGQLSQLGVRDTGVTCKSVNIEILFEIVMVWAT